jgi:hypothetical protein
MSTVRRSIVAALAAFPALAQAGNELIFVGTSTSGTTDNSAFVASGSGALLLVGPSGYTNNVNDAIWADTGRNLYCAQSIGPMGGPGQVSRAEWDGTSPTWSTFFAAPGACYGLGLDSFRGRLWVLTGAGPSTRELHCLDADPLSPTYGTVLAQTSSLTGASRERWGLSPSGNFAAVPHTFVNGGLFEIVDTNPASSTFQQIVVSTTIPGAASAGFAFVSDCRISIDDAYAYVLYAGAGVGGLAVYELGTQTWLDFSPSAGQQDMQVGVGVPNSMALSVDRSFALVAGGGAPSGVSRIDFDYANPSNSTATVFGGFSAPNCNGLSLSPDGTRACVTSTNQPVAPPGSLIVFDSSTGATLHTVALGNLWNIYTTAWQDASPTATFTTFGSGCAGTNGVPTLAAAAGSRPALGSTFTVEAGNLPYGIALLMIGLSNVQTGAGIPLPIDLGFLGMPGCPLLVDPEINAPLIGIGNSASWNWPLPPQASLFGIHVYLQAFSLDPTANAFGFVASNGGIGMLGF